MVNKKQLALLKRGSKVWNQWRQKNPDAKVELSNAILYYADLSHADLSVANLSLAKLSRTNLSNADLGGADLSSADLDGAKLNRTDLFLVNLRNANLKSADLHNANLSRANLSGAYLSHAYLSHADLSNTKLRGADLSSAFLYSADFSNANLSNTKLRGATLSNANLSNTKLSGADLSSANLLAAQVLGTTFMDATLTGACIQDWQLGSSTRLEGVQCDYIFRTYDSEKQQFTGRLPVDPESTFAAGEFTQRFQIIASALETIDITFTEGIDWQAFFSSFQELRSQYPDKDIAVQGMQEKGNTFIVSLKVEAEETGEDLQKLKGEIETSQKQLYSTQLALREAQGEIKVYREMMGVVQTLAGRPMSDQNFYGNVGNVANTNQGKMQAVLHNYAPEQRQSLAEAAQEIQALLNQLSKTYGPTQVPEKAVEEIKAKPELKARVIGALKGGGKAALEELIDHPAVAIVLAAIEGASDPD